MSGVGEASAVFGLVTGSIALIKLAIDIYDATNGDGPERIKKVASQLPSIMQLLENAQMTKDEQDPAWIQAKSDVERCHKECEALTAIFEKAFPRDDGNGLKRAWKAGVVIFTGKRSEAEQHLAEIFKTLSTLQMRHIITNTALLETIKATLEELDQGEAGIVHYGSGHNNVVWGSGTFNQQTGENSRIISAVNYFEASSKSHNSADSLAAGLSFFKTSNYESYKNDLNPERVPGTCRWFLDHPKYVRWQSSSNDDFLWLSADPGCGKSVLSRALVDDALVGNSSTLILHFFFKDNGEQNDISVSLCALLHQLFRSRRSLFTQYASPTIEDEGVSLKTDFHQLWKLFLQAAKDADAGDVVCVLDALDECREQQRSILLLKLKEFYRGCTPSTSVPPKGCLKFLVTSRPYQVVSSTLDDGSSLFPSIHLAGEDESEAISKEIELVIRAKFESFGRDFMRDEEHQARSLKIILAMRNRTYLWLKFVMEELQRVTPSTSIELHEIVKQLPSDVDHAYEKMLSRCPVRSRAIEILQIVVAAQRPLTLKELDVALTVTNHSRSHRKLALAGTNSRERQIRNLCGLFLCVVKSKIYLIHQTAREFLICHTEDVSSHLWKGSITLVNAHRTLAEYCITYLLLDELQDTNDTVEMACNLYPFLAYSALHWTTHFRKSNSNTGSTLAKAAAELYHSKNELGALWFEVSARDMSEMMAVDFSFFLSVGVLSSRTALQAMSYYGHHTVFSSSALDQYSQKRKNQAIYWAAAKNYGEVVTLVVDNGGDVNARGRFFEKHGSALTVASREGHSAMVQLLLGYGASVEVSCQGISTRKKIRKPEVGTTEPFELDAPWERELEPAKKHFLTGLGPTPIPRPDGPLRFKAKSRVSLRCPVAAAMEEGHEYVVYLLLETGPHPCSAVWQINKPEAVRQKVEANLRREKQLEAAKDRVLAREVERAQYQRSFHPLHRLLDTPHPLRSSIDSERTSWSRHTSPPAPQSRWFDTPQVATKCDSSEPVLKRTGKLHVRIEMHSSRPSWNYANHALQTCCEEQSKEVADERELDIDDVRSTYIPRYPE